MRITHVITRLVVGGAQENTISSVLGLRKNPAFEVNLVSGPSPGPEGSLESTFANLPGVLTIVPELVRPVHPWKDWIALRRLTKIFHATKPQIVHTHSGKAGILGRLAAARANVPIIIHHIHGPSFGPFQGAIANFVFTAAERYAARVTTHFLCTANAMAKLYLAAGIGTPETYTRVLSGFRMESFLNPPDSAPLRAKLGIGPNDFVIGKIGRLAPLKGHADLLQAVRALLPQIPNVKILFVGSGALRSEIENQSRALGLERHVIFTGLVRPEEMPRYIAATDCVAHLSRREALSRALPQALATGKPVVSYDFDGADEVCLESETGFLVRTGDIATATNRLLQLANDPDLRRRLGKRGQEMVAKLFTIEHMIEQQSEIYMRLAKARGISVP
jgi:glycosyltransferase involved in cell wall biosynthesis